MQMLRTCAVSLSLVLLAACSDAGGSTDGSVEVSTDPSVEPVTSVANGPRPHGDVDFSMAFDAEAATVVAIDRRGTWLFDVTADRWVSQGASRPEGQLPKLVYSPMAKGVLAISTTGEVFAYDVAADSWTKRSGPVWSGRVRPLVGLDEESGDVVAIEPTVPRAWSYDVASGEWTEIDHDGAIGARTAGDGGMLMTYNPGVSGFVVLDYRAILDQASNDVWRFDPQSGTWTELAAMPMISFGYFPLGQEATFAASSGRSVFVSFGVVAEYDSLSDSWTTYVNGAAADSTSTVGEPKRMGAHLVYDPVNERVLMYAGTKLESTDWEWADDMWAYDAVTHQWSLVLAAT